MEPTTINSFLDQFIAVTDAGFGLIQSDVSYVLNALITISIVLAGTQWALAQEAPLGPFFRKVLFIGLFAFLVNNWNLLATAINSSGAMLGLRAGGGGMSLEDLHNPGRIADIGKDLFGRAMELGEGMNVLTDFQTLVTILITAFLVMIAFFVLALQVFVALIAFKIGSLVAFVALPWGVFNGTSWVAERPLGWVVGSAMRLFVLGLIASVAITFVDTLPVLFSIDDGALLNVLLFGATILVLAILGPQLASEVVQGQPHLSGGDVVQLGANNVMYATGLSYSVGGAIRVAGAALGATLGAARAGYRMGRSAFGGSRPNSPAKIDHSKIQPPKKSDGGKS